MGPKMIVRRDFHFDAAHYLPNYKGDCQRMHDHRWVLTVAYQGALNDTSGFVLDFKVLKEIVNNTLRWYDHDLLNDRVTNPTCENILLSLWKSLSNYETGLGYHLHELTLWEGRDTRVTLTREEMENEYVNRKSGGGTD